MPSYTLTNQVFLSLLGLVYLAAFTSLYVQLPGLYGRDGLEPVDTFLDRVQASAGARSPKDLFYRLPTLLWWHQQLGLFVDQALDAICMAGMLCAAVAALGLCWAPLQWALWLLYLSLLNVGQTFLSFQWDILLVEVGWASIWIAPLKPAVLWRTALPSTADTVGKTPHASQPSLAPPGVLLLRWILFKLMFMAGVVKIQARCPTWLNLTACHYHFATQCIPTPSSWYAHQLPHVLLQLFVAGTLVIEIPATALILMPFRGARILGAVLQLFLQLNIIITGNYNFFNLLAMLLTVSLLDDDVITWLLLRSRSQGHAMTQKDSQLQSMQSNQQELKSDARPKPLQPQSSKLAQNDTSSARTVWRLACQSVGLLGQLERSYPAATLAACVAPVLYCSWAMFKVQYMPGQHPSASLTLAFTPDQLDDVLLRTLPWVTCYWMGFLCLSCVVHVATDMRSVARRGSYCIDKGRPVKRKRHLAGTELLRRQPEQQDTPSIHDNCVKRQIADGEGHSSNQRSNLPLLQSLEKQSLRSTTLTPNSERKLTGAVATADVPAACTGLGLCTCCMTVAWTTICAVAVLGTFVSGVPTIFQLQPQLAARISQYPLISQLYAMSQPFHLASGYGLFRRMTGVGDAGSGERVARPELEILGSDDGVKWLAYRFHAKPGDPRLPPPFVVPHQPRLDWQMWFAALGSYQQNPWLLHLVYKLLKGNKAVLKLLHPHSPFQNRSPQYIKADLYHYDFTHAPWARPRKHVAGTQSDAGQQLEGYSVSMDETGASNQTSWWWERTYVRSYLPVIHQSDPQLKQIIRDLGWLQKPARSKNKRTPAAAPATATSSATATATPATATASTQLKLHAFVQHVMRGWWVMLRPCLQACAVWSDWARMNHVLGVWSLLLTVMMGQAALCLLHRLSFL